MPRGALAAGSGGLRDSSSGRGWLSESIADSEVPATCVVLHGSKAVEPSDALSLMIVAVATVAP